MKIIRKKSSENCKNVVFKVNEQAHKSLKALKRPPYGIDVDEMFREFVAELILESKYKSTKP